MLIYFKFMNFIGGEYNINEKKCETLAIISIFLIASEFSMVFLFRRLSYSWVWLATFIIKCFTLSYFRNHSISRFSKQLSQWQ